MIRIGIRFWSLLASAFLAVLAACSFGYSMYSTQASYVPVPSPSQASISFFWNASISASVSTFVAMPTSNGQLALVGALGPGQRIVQVLNPGEYTFVMGGESAQVLKANLEAGKNYYVQVVPTWDGIVPRFNFNPLTPQQIVNTPNLANNIQNSVVVVPNQNGMEWFQLNIGSLQDKLNHPSSVVELKPSDGLYNPL